MEIREIGVLTNWNVELQERLYGIIDYKNNADKNRIMQEIL